MGNICIIPARGGSKRIPRKNIKPFLGKPIIAYSIQAALDSGLFDEIMVSTDDNEIAEIAKQYGAKVPFLRSKKNSDDFTGTGDVCYEVLNLYESMNIFFNNVCCLYPTAPFISKKVLLEGYETLMSNNGVDCVISLGLYNTPIERSYGKSKTGIVEFNFPEFEKYRSQDLPDNFFDVGQFYWFLYDEFKKLENKNSFGIKKNGVVLDEMRIQDIDTLSDWEIAEFKYTYLINNKNDKQ